MEKRILAEMLNKSPYLTKLYCTFQDEHNLCKKIPFKFGQYFKN